MIIFKKMNLNVKILILKVDGESTPNQIFFVTVIIVLVLECIDFCMYPPRNV